MKNCIQIIGKDLTKEQLEQINKLREKEFKSAKPVDPKNNQKDSRKNFLILNSEINKKVLSFCILHKVKIEFDETETELLGFSNLISSEKGKGYGTKVLKCIKEYSGSMNIPVLGFCKPELENFYEKNGFKIIDGGINKFIYSDELGNVIPPSNTESIAFILDNSNELFTKINNFRKKIRISTKNW